ncbi:MAG TPA: hypothetical protein VNV86_22100 [Candidatus Acidoferrum sp.]|jgi:hypothetical protein|nr:hypothetical protein [Candidatus Acidoferrum sp.]
MKLTALRLTFAAAAMLAAATTASAQTMKAEIPFSFEARNVLMQAGSYTVTLSHTSGGMLAEIYSVDQRRSVLALPHISESPLTPQNSTPVLTFACAEGRCALLQMRDAASTVYRFGTSKPTAGTHIATVMLRPDRAE